MLEISYLVCLDIFLGNFELNSFDVKQYLMDIGTLEGMRKWGMHSDKVEDFGVGFLRV